MYKHQNISMYEANILDHLMQPTKRGQKNPAMIQIINYEINVLLLSLDQGKTSIIWKYLNQGKTSIIWKYLNSGKDIDYMEITSDSIQLEYNKMSVGNIIYHNPKGVYVPGIKPPPNTLATFVPKVQSCTSTKYNLNNKWLMLRKKYQRIHKFNAY